MRLAAVAKAIYKITKEKCVSQVYGHVAREKEEIEKIFKHKTRGKFTAH